MSPPRSSLPVVFVPGPPHGIALDKLTSSIVGHLEADGVVGLRGRGNGSLERVWQGIGAATRDRNAVVVDEKRRSRGVEATQRNTVRSSRRSTQRLAWRLLVKATSGRAILDVEGGTVDPAEGHFPNARMLIHQDDQRLVYLCGPVTLAIPATEHPPASDRTSDHASLPG